MQEIINLYKKCLESVAEKNMDAFQRAFIDLGDAIKLESSRRNVINLVEKGVMDNVVGRVDNMIQQAIQAQEQGKTLTFEQLMENSKSPKDNLEIEAKIEIPEDFKSRNRA